MKDQAFLRSKTFCQRVCQVGVLIAMITLAATGFAADKDPICGKWKWISGNVHVFGPGGAIVGESGCTWKRVQGTKPAQYIVTWGKATVDTLELIKNGTELRGKNTEGGEVWGKRIRK